MLKLSSWSQRSFDLSKHVSRLLRSSRLRTFAQQNRNMPLPPCVVSITNPRIIESASSLFVYVDEVSRATTDFQLIEQRAIVLRSCVWFSSDLHRASEEPERDRVGKGGMVCNNLLWRSNRLLLDPQWSCSSTPSTVPRAHRADLAALFAGGCRSSRVLHLVELMVLLAS